MELTGRTALITGAAKRIGREIALELARSGANIAITFRSSHDEAEETVSELLQLGIKATALKLDLSDTNEINRAIGSINKELGPIDLLVNNASHFEPTPFPTLDHHGWHKTFDVILHGAYYLANAVSPEMLNRRTGRIINMVDLSAWHPWPDRGAHSIAKSALLALTRQLAVELAPHVTVNAVAPGPSVPATSFDQDQINRLTRRTLLGRWGGAAEVAAAVKFLAASDFVTGECLTVDGGEKWGHVRDRFKDR